MAMQNTYLDFTEIYFEKMGISTHIIDLSKPLLDDVDLGLRKAILSDPGSEDIELKELLSSAVKLNSITLTEDIYGCHYMIIPIPAQEESLIFMAGPYQRESPSIYKSQQLCKKLGIPPGLFSYVNQYFSSLPCIELTSSLEAYIESLGEKLYGEGNYRIEYHKQAQTGSASEYVSAAQSDSNERTMQLLEHRYDMEEKMMEAISRGDFESALHYSSDMAFSGIDDRAPSTLRSRKNLLFVFSTLCRKAAQRAKVHPVYLDEMSRRMSIRIENITSLTEEKDVYRDILRKYCMMVQQNTTRGYSPIMQKVINYISQNLDSTDLTLNNTADALSLNKSYLATLFKKEAGETFTGYVNKKRMDHAIFLLNTGDASIQSIASACGIPDCTYFTRLFKREKGMSPSQYRNMIK